MVDYNNIIEMRRLVKLYEQERYYIENMLAYVNGSPLMMDCKKICEGGELTDGVLSVYTFDIEAEMTCERLIDGKGSNVLMGEFRTFQQELEKQFNTECNRINKTYRKEMKEHEQQKSSEKNCD